MIAYILKLIFSVLLTGAAYESYGQQPTITSVTSDRTLRGIIAYPGVTALNSKSFFIMKDSTEWHIHPLRFYFDSIFKDPSHGSPVNLFWVDPTTKQAVYSSVDSLTINSGQINGLSTTINSALSPYLTSATAAATYQPIGTYATASNTMTFTNKSGNISQWTNDAGYVTQNNVYAAGTGITKTGSEPNATFSINQTDVMMVSRAADSISVINDKINGKVPQIRTLQFTAGTGISVSPTGAQDLSANRSWTISATGTSPGTNNAAAYSAGTVYTLTATSQKIDFGTTDPVITIPAAGTYLIFTNLKIEYSGLTTILNTCNFKLRRTNNTAADIPNAATNFGVVATLLTGTGGDVDIAPVIYTTSNSNDVIELWGNRQNGISITGSINVGEASIVAVRIY